MEPPPTAPTVHEKDILTMDIWGNIHLSKYAQSLIHCCVAGSVPVGVLLVAMQTLLVCTFAESTNFL